MKNIFFVTLFLLLLSSCVNEIDLNLTDKSGNIVIEGNITDQPGPYIIRITRSTGMIQNSQYQIVTNAKVIVSDNTSQTETLTYAGDGKYQTTDFKGVAGRTYTLQVEADGKQYSAQSTMPTAVDFEDLKQDSFIPEGRITYKLLPIFKDPPALGNRYLFNIIINNYDKKYKLFSDYVNNGTLNQKAITLPNSGFNAVKVGDVIEVEMQCIDNNIFAYYNTFLKIIENNDVNFDASSSNPSSNITNGGLGYFSAHSVRKRNIIIK
ncbi:hypothetical protein CEY12_20560 [Chryseobacterium sp. T16E-39]|uniref:DUF4249 domain-containing protein n=1 Tax=Chryseobacterium sp. T16E-39 TaxID=2015076 RepID=UPI000B5B42A9|nr:DUF4249 domain-containing protein [Chryseobacterium sp. T16E-39]ASK32326.1 hypothetical protein CEY12_20560 [Chryseobacterium sp. T16E-39]